MFVKFHLKSAISCLFFILTSSTIYLQYFVTFFLSFSFFLGGGLILDYRVAQNSLSMAGLELMTMFLFQCPDCCWPYRCESLGSVISVPSEDVLEFLRVKSWLWSLSFCSFGVCHVVCYWKVICLEDGSRLESIFLELLGEIVEIPLFI